jgi:hypothetical protein
LAQKAAESERRKVKFPQIIWTSALATACISDAKARQSSFIALLGGGSKRGKTPTSTLLWKDGSDISIRNMALTRLYKETVLARIQRDREFARVFFAGALEAAGGADDDGGLAAQEDAQTFLLNGRVEAADDGAARVAQLGDAVEGVEAGRAGTFRGTEQRRERLAQRGGAADDVKDRGRVCAAAKQGGRIIGRVGRDTFDLHE